MAKDFKSNQIKTNKIIGNNDASNAKLIIYPQSSSTDDNGGIDPNMLSSVGNDTFLFVSGSICGKKLSKPNTVTVFGGDVVVSGSLYRERSEVSLWELDPDDPDSLIPTNILDSHTGIWALDLNIEIDETDGSIYGLQYTTSNHKEGADKYFEFDEEGSVMPRDLDAELEKCLEGILVDVDNIIDDVQSYVLNYIRNTAESISLENTLNDLARQDNNLLYNMHWLLNNTHLTDTQANYSLNNNYPVENNLRTELIQTYIDKLSTNNSTLYNLIDLTFNSVNNNTLVPLKTLIENTMLTYFSDYGSEASDFLTFMPNSPSFDWSVEINALFNDTSLADISTILFDYISGGDLIISYLGDNSIFTDFYLIDILNDLIPNHPSIELYRKLLSDVLVLDVINSIAAGLSFTTLINDLINDIPNHTIMEKLNN